MAAEFTARGRDGVDELDGIGRRLIVDGYLKGDPVLTPARPCGAATTSPNPSGSTSTAPTKARTGAFFDKLRVRFDDASDGAIQLFAELFLLNVLPLA
ncbi:hypothetical protein MPY17_39580 (plasmid) [Rhodococcus opacus]|uniref:hypothetical protein n=1 Tax=Rhodococcus opacus TaxID=37919 RepID=UPI001FF50DAE|nr:hypothetical protein [Rhodococcus opacus]UOT08500.1 hypothetical protein MPY17_39580 [Rhodococcus opacus]